MTEERIKQLAMGKWEAFNGAPGWEEICELAELAGVGLAAQARVRELEETIDDLLCQFAYQTIKNGKPAYGTGGLSALENAFGVMGWNDPHPCPENKCEVGDCREWATCGTPVGDGYKRCCYEHYAGFQNKETPNG